MGSGQTQQGAKEDRGWQRGRGSRFRYLEARAAKRRQGRARRVSTGPRLSGSISREQRPHLLLQEVSGPQRLRFPSFPRLGVLACLGRLPILWARLVGTWYEHPVVQHGLLSPTSGDTAALGRHSAPSCPRESSH